MRAVRRGPSVRVIKAVHPLKPRSKKAIRPKKPKVKHPKKH